MNKGFWIDRQRNMYKSYNDFIKDINSKNSVSKYIYAQNPYQVYVDIINSAINNYDVVLLDSDFSEKEINNLGIDYSNLEDFESLQSVQVSDYNQLIEILKSNIDTWKLTLFTSGTTGRPKQVNHTIRTLTRAVKQREHHKSDIWAFAYNPTHFAGLQVFFQAFLNQNQIIYIFDEKKEKIQNLLEQYRVTNISATPTFYRTLIPYLDADIPGIKRITFGGETFDNNLACLLKKHFSNAVVKNIYASTEAGSLFSSEGEHFYINAEISKYIKTNENGELLISSELLASSDDYKLENGWYNTGDIIEYVSDDCFIFVSRKSEMINVGGYKVNPNEIEAEIRKVQGVVDVSVKPRQNSVTGNILVAEIIKEKDLCEKDLKIKISEQLSKNLQPWKIPRIYKFVDKIEMTRTGKKVRN